MLEPILLENRACQGCNSLALADDIESHALAYFALRVAVGDQRLIAMRVHIDVAGRNDPSFRGDGASAVIRPDVPDSGDFPVFDRDIAVKPRISGAVDYAPAVNNNIELRHFTSVVHTSPYITEFLLKQRDVFRRIAITSANAAACTSPGRC